jgi:tetratricopeptide (TPR) repeat protein
MKQHLLVVMAFATLFCISGEVYAQYPGMRQEAWYKENVLKQGTPDAIVEEVEPETEGVLQQMQKLQADKKWNEMLDLYPQAKVEYGRNRQVYGYARFALRNLLGENSNQKQLDELDKIYADYFSAGFNPDTYSYQGRDNGNQWNEMQQMLDYARFSSCVDFETRSSKIMAFVNAQEGKADPWIIYNGVMLPINEQLVSNIDKIRKDDKKAEDFYLRLTEIQTELEREDAILKEQSPQYPLYGMDRKLDAVQTNRMLVIPFREYIKLYPESEIDAHKSDEAYLSKRSEEMSARWPKEALTKKVENYYANIGATYVKFKTLGVRSLDQKNYGDAVSNFQRSLELAENDNQRAEGNYFIATANYQRGSYLQAWNSINKAIDLNNSDMRFYNSKYYILIGLTSTTSGQYQRLDINILITTAIQTLTKAKSVCEREGQEKEFDRCETNLVEARKQGHRYAIERAQLFMKGLSFGQMYQMQSGDVKLSAPLTEY